MDWEIVIGLEIHAQLATASKIFSGASTRYGAEPNTQASLVDLGYPGVLPVLNGEAVKMAVKFGLATLSAISGQAMIPRERLVGMLLDYIARSRRHMSFEESTVFPRARAMVSEQDWKAIERGVPHKEDPLFGGTVSEQYCALYRLIMRESGTQ